MKIGYFLSCEKYSPTSLLHQARLAEQAGGRPGRGRLRDGLGESTAHGPDIDAHINAFKPFAEPDIDVVQVQQIGGAREVTSSEGFFESYANDVLPRLRELA